MADTGRPVDWPYLKDCTHCGASPQKCGQKIVDSDAAAPVGETNEARARRRHNAECCANCQHIT